MDLTTLPELTLLHLTTYLEASDLQNLSATCKTLRYILNSNQIWKRVTHRGQLLSEMTCVVKPKFKNPPSGPLPPLCENRVNYLRQCWLVNNYKKALFSVEILGFSHNVPKVNSLHSEQKCIYNDTYFIIFQFHQGGNEKAYLFDIEKPTYISGCDIPKSTNTSQSRYFWSCHMAENSHLLIFRPYGVDVYKIWLDPFRISLLHFIDTPKAPSYKNIKLYSPYLFLMDENEDTLHIWDVYSGKLVKKVYQKGNEPCYYVLQSSGDIQTSPENSLFEVGRPHQKCVEGLSDRVTIYGFDVEMLQFAQFNIIWNVKKSEPIPHIFSQGKLVVLVLQKSSDCYIYLYDYRKCIAVSERQFKLKYVYRIKILESYLLMASDKSLQIMNSNKLEILWELSHYGYYRDFIYWNIENKYQLLILKNMDAAEVWNFSTRKRVKVLPCFECEGYYVDSTFSRVVNFFENGRQLVVYKFW